MSSEDLTQIPPTPPVQKGPAVQEKTMSDTSASWENGKPIKHMHKSSRVSTLMGSLGGEKKNEYFVGPSN